MEHKTDTNAKPIKVLTRSQDNRVFSGVLGGTGEYFDVDPVIIRLIFVLATAFSGFIPGIVAYILAIVIVPEKPRI